MTPSRAGPSASDIVLIKDLNVRNIIGVDNWERQRRQPVVINVRVQTDISAAAETDLVDCSVHYGVLCKKVTQFAEGSSFKSLEALASALCDLTLGLSNVKGVTVRVDKPRALLHAESAGVQLTRYLPLTASEAAAGENEAEEEEGRGFGISNYSVSGEDDLVIIKGLRLSTIVGVNVWERHETQVVILDLTIHCKFTLSELKGDHVAPEHNFRTIVRHITDTVESSKFKTIEALAICVARTAIVSCGVGKISVNVHKPSALLFAAAAGVEITRTRNDFDQSVASESLNSSGVIPEIIQLVAAPTMALSAQPSPSPAATPASPIPPSIVSGISTVYIAIGTNIGDRAKNIHDAIRMLGAHGRVVDTSFLYTTKPMYVVDQPEFLNGVLQFETTLPPHDLLAALKNIEATLGRDLKGGIRNGPRPIDLDIIFYDQLVMETPTLTIPHMLCHERAFVLRPLCDINPYFIHPVHQKTVSRLLKLIPAPANMSVDTPADADMIRVTPIRNELIHWYHPLSNPSAKTLVMGILNCTPDSFSDGGDHFEPKAAADSANVMTEQGADILDIGGASTRPGAVDVPVAEEERRVVGTIAAIRSSNSQTPISVDTFVASVAKSAIQAGADMINDVSGGTLDKNMFAVAAELQVPVCLMHMRGTPKTMTKLTDYAGGDVVRGVIAELDARVRAALRAGVYRWNIIVDPGIGFAKTHEQNLVLLRRLGELTGYSAMSGASSGSVGGAVSGGGAHTPSTPAGSSTTYVSPLARFPCLVGTSRKGFIGTITGRTEPKDRAFGTAATVTAAIASGAAIIRVHDVPEMVDAARTADKIWH
ncbi:Dihydropteroate synthase [Ramicandelaber brevisporus]|nr:Dihydropteroate synthase [Ramicandelaber brevisporus]